MNSFDKNNEFKLDYLTGGYYLYATGQDLLRPHGMI